MTENVLLLNVKKLCCYTTTVLLFHYKIIKRSVRVLKHRPWASLQTCIKYSRVQILWISFINNIIAGSVHFCGIWWKSIRNKHSVWTLTWLHIHSPTYAMVILWKALCRWNLSKLNIHLVNHTKQSPAETQTSTHWNLIR